MQGSAVLVVEQGQGRLRSVATFGVFLCLRAWRGGEPRRRCEVAGRAQAGGANTSGVQGHCARARVGGALTFRLDLALLARRQREDEVDPEGLDVRG